MLIFDYRSRFLMKFSIFLGFFLQEFTVMFSPRPREMVTKSDLFWDFTLVGVPSSGQNQKISSDYSQC
jgi:hypothetical protein